MRAFGLFQVVVALHGLGVVWGDIKPDNFVFRGDRLVAVDFGSTCVEVGSIAQRELGAAADTSFTSRPSDQFAWSVQYAAPERARTDRLGVPCVARRSQVCFVAKHTGGATEKTKMIPSYSPSFHSMLPFPLSSEFVMIDDAEVRTLTLLHLPSEALEKFSDVCYVLPMSHRRFAPGVPRSHRSAQSKLGGGNNS